MDQRRSFPWAWILLTIVIVVIVGGIAYYLGAMNAQPVAFARPFHRVVMFGHGFGFGPLGFWLPVLIIALLVGLLVAALARPSRPRETFEEWHRRAHGEGTGPGGPQTHEHAVPPSGDAPASSSANEPPSGSSSA